MPVFAVTQHGAPAANGQPAVPTKVTLRIGNNVSNAEGFVPVGLLENDLAHGQIARMLLGDSINDRDFAALMKVYYRGLGYEG